MNSNGALDIGDVQSLLVYQDSQSVTNNLAEFDFNSNGKIDIGDVQALFAEYVG